MTTTGGRVYAGRAIAAGLDGDQDGAVPRDSR
jgi:hypothetical protein